MKTPRLVLLSVAYAAYRRQNTQLTIPRLMLQNSLELVSSKYLFNIMIKPYVCPDSSITTTNQRELQTLQSHLLELCTNKHSSSPEDIPEFRFRSIMNIVLYLLFLDNATTSAM